MKNIMFSTVSKIGSSPCSQHGRGGSLTARGGLLTTWAAKRPPPSVRISARYLLAANGPSTILNFYPIVI